MSTVQLEKIEVRRRGKPRRANEIVTNLVHVDARHLARHLTVLVVGNR